MLNGLLNLSVWGDIIAALIMTHITIIGVTVYLHRHQAHRALDMHPIPSHFFRFWLWLTTGMQTKAWAAIHRKHHARCETVEDPHSPQVLGIKKVLLEGAELYRKEAVNQETLDRYGHGTPDDWMEKNVYVPHSAAGIFVMLGIDLLLFGLPGISIWGVQMLWIPIFAAGIINGVGHYWGYRNYECTDASRNIFPWGILIGGEELHNNHHTFGTSAKLSAKWWEFDLGWCYIRTLQFLGLAKVKKSIPVLESTNKQDIDVETVKAFVSHRFQVMASYANEVIQPVLKEEMERASSTSRSILRRAKSLLVRADNLVCSEDKEYIMQKILPERQKLQLVYQYRQRLQAIWDKTTASQRELVEALQEWCKQAEETGIEALSNFAVRLRGFQTKKA